MLAALAMLAMVAMMARPRATCSASKGKSVKIGSTRR
jgi:hypothetical protein